MFAVLVTGLPGSGKTTIAVPLAEQLGLPLIAKDHIKELLADHLGTGPVAARYGAAAVRLMLALAERAPRVVLESFFWPGTAEPELLALRRPLVQVHCECPAQTARERFEQRMRSGQRHPVHRFPDDWDRFASSGGPLHLPGPLICVDTSQPVAVDDLVQRVREALGGLLPVRA